MYRAVALQQKVSQHTELLLETVDVLKIAP
jgi:hypothetical protein